MRLFTIAAIALLLTGCELVTGLMDDTRMGTLGYPDNLRIEVPDVVTVHDEFTVTVRTIGPDGCWRKDRTRVARRGMSATITPYDSQPYVWGGTACTLAPVEILHTATLRFGEAGTAHVVIQGRDGTVERSVVVGLRGADQE